MAQAILKRLRGQLSSEDDDYFQDTELLDYINEGYKSVASHAIKLEMGRPKKQGRSIRALDPLRTNDIVNNLSFDKERSYYVSKVNLSEELKGDFLDIQYVGADVSGNLIVMAEILRNLKYERAWGLLHPTERQGYYEYTGENEITVMMASKSSTTKLFFDYIKNVTAINDQTEELPELPSRLINAVIFKACILAGISELRENTESIASLYQSEIQTHLW